MTKTASKLVGSLVVATFAATSLSATAFADTESGLEGTAIERRAAEADRIGVFVFGVDDPAIERSGEEVIYNHGAIDDDTLVVIPTSDGVYPGGLSEDEMRALVQDGGAEAVATIASETSQESDVTPQNATAIISALPGGAWGNWVSHPNWLIGTTWTAPIYYSWFIDYQWNQTGCAQGVGYTRKVGGTATIRRIYGIGCTSSGNTTGGTAIWGNVAAYPEARGRSLGVHALTGRFYF